MKSRDVRKKPKQSAWHNGAQAHFIVLLLLLLLLLFFAPKLHVVLSPLCRGVLWSAAMDGGRERSRYVLFFNQRGGIEAFGLTILAILNIRFSVFVPKKLWSFGFLVHFGLRILRDLAFGFRFSSKIHTGSRNFFDLPSIWAAIKPHHWSQKIAKRRC